MSVGSTRTYKLPLKHYFTLDPSRETHLFLPSYVRHGQRISRSTLFRTELRVREYDDQFSGLSTRRCIEYNQCMYFVRTALTVVVHPVLYAGLANFCLYGRGGDSHQGAHGKP